MRGSVWTYGEGLIGENVKAKCDVSRGKMSSKYNAKCSETKLWPEVCIKNE
jgi:hypothetical protein